MNPKIYAKVFQDLKKQQTKYARLRRPQLIPDKTNNSPLRHSNPQQPSSTSILQNRVEKAELRNEGQVKQEPKQQIEQKRQQVIIKKNEHTKKIAKKYERYENEEKNVKKWKHDLYSKLEKMKTQYQQKKERTILIEGSNYQQLISVLKNYKIYIEQILDYKVILNDSAKVNQCLQLLLKSGLRARKIVNDKQQNNQEPSHGKIFERLK